jgi:hypothetical protein
VRDERREIVDVVLQIEWLDAARPLVPPAVVHDDVKGLETSNETGERATSVEAAVDADDGGLGVEDAALGDGESRDWRVGDEVKSLEGRRGRGHQENLPGKTGATHRISRDGP